MDIARKRLLFKLLTGVVSASLIIAGIGVYVGINNKTTNETIDNGNSLSNDSSLSSEVIKNEGLDIHFVNERTNDDGSVTQTFKYEVTPENATNKDVRVQIEYETGYECNDVISYTKNVTMQRIEITCHKAFDTPIRVTLFSLSNEDVYATVMLQYEKKLLMVDASCRDLLWGEDFTTFDKSLMITTEYSVFTLDKEYTFTYEVVEFIYSDGLQEWPDVINSFSQAIINMAENDTEWNAGTWWELDDRNEWHSSLIEYGDDALVTGSLIVNVTCEETGDFVEEACCEISIPLKMDYSEYEVYVDTLGTNVTELIF